MPSSLSPLLLDTRFSMHVATAVRRTCPSSWERMRKDDPLWWTLVPAPLCGKLLVVQRAVWCAVHGMCTDITRPRCPQAARAGGRWGAHARAASGPPRVGQTGSLDHTMTHTTFNSRSWWTREQQARDYYATTSRSSHIILRGRCRTCAAQCAVAWVYIGSRGGLEGGGVTVSG